VLSAVEVSPNARVSRRIFLSCSSSSIVFPNGSIAIAVLYHIGLVSVKNYGNRFISKVYESLAS
jgi:hypothetical protein